MVDDEDAGADPCTDGLDNDGDGWTDADDPDCNASGYEVGYGTAACNNGIDDDQDGTFDAGDDTCIYAGFLTEG